MGESNEYDYQPARQYAWDVRALRRVPSFSRIEDKDIKVLQTQESVITGRSVDYLLLHYLKKARKREKEANKHRPSNQKLNVADKTLIVSHNFYTKIAGEKMDNETSPNYSTSQDMGGHLHDPWFYRRIMFPCFINHIHWILIVWEFRAIDFDKHLKHHKHHKHHKHKAKRYIPTVRIYDSIHDRSWGDYAWPIVMHYIFRHIKHAKDWVTKCEPIQMWGDKDRLHENYDRVPTQRDGNNCAFYVIQMGKSILYNRNPKNYYNAPKIQRIEGLTVETMGQITQEQLDKMTAQGEIRANFDDAVEAQKYRWSKKIQNH
jgi:hypothetical protein